MKRSRTPYKGSNHYLHRAYRAGHEAAQNMPADTSRNEEDAECPHCSGTHEYNWWWDGWNSVVSMRTGYFGRASGEGGKALVTNVHVTNNSDNPICGYKPHPTLRFQWCANRLVFHYVGCSTCRRLVQQRGI